ncbi:MAG: carboxypeptidase regulatory-like domain-containing protein, partial [bacterium]|nr:carboxypeptidase regulatory-like domain-containing protein [bacterium]
LRLEGDLDLVIEITTAEVSGRVLAAGGEALADALVVLQRLLAPESGSEGGVYTLGTDADGRFRFARISGGRYRLSVRKDGYGTWQQMLAVDAVGDSLEVVLEPTAGLELVVQLASGERPRYVTVHVSDHAGGRIAAESRSLEADGHVRFPTVPPGTWSLLVGAPGAAPARADAEVPGEPIGLVLPVGGRLEVRVPALAASPLVATVGLFDPEGQPFVGLDGATSTPRRAWPLEGGRGVVEGLPAGLWSVEVAAADGQRWSATVLTSGGEAAIRIE